mgnify:FL=1
MNLKVKETYKNKHTDAAYECQYLLKDYADITSLELKKIITDVEDLVYLANGSSTKDAWTEEEQNLFEKIRRRLLNTAGSISRLPDTIYDDPNTGDVWGELFR